MNRLTIIPQNNYVLCKCITDNKKMLSSGFVYETNDVPLYEIIKISENFKHSTIDVNIGDVIRTDSSGTVTKLDNNEYVLFDAEHIVGKVVE